MSLCVQILENLTTSDVAKALQLSETVLDKVLHLRSKVFMLEFILEKLSSHVSTVRRDELANLCMGVKVVSCNSLASLHLQMTSCLRPFAASQM